jgi:hypothetical protein
MPDRHPVFGSFDASVGVTNATKKPQPLARLVGNRVFDNNIRSNLRFRGRPDGRPLAVYSSDCSLFASDGDNLHVCSARPRTLVSLGSNDRIRPLDPLHGIRPVAHLCASCRVGVNPKVEGS